MSEAAIERCSPKIMLFPTILDFDNKLREGTKILMYYLKDISKRVPFYKAAAVQPTYLLKRGLLQRKILIIMLTPILYSGTTLRRI